MATTATRYKNNRLSTTAAVFLGAASLFGLQACGGGGGGTPAVVPGVTLGAASVTEGNSGTTNLDFTVTLSEATTVNITVAYATSDGTAIAGEDYTATSGTLTVPANSTSATISVPVIGEAVTEPDEAFNLTISSAANATIANGSATVSGDIINDDLAGYYTGSISVNEGVGTLALADPEIQVIAADDRLVIINIANNLVYIAPFTGFSSGSFVTTARIYKDGDFTTTTEISGTFITGASMNLTLAGTGDYTTGTVTLAYSAKNSVAPKVFVAAGQWQDTDTVTTMGMTFASNTISDITTGGNVLSSTLNSCGAFPDDVALIAVNSEQTGRIRSFAATTDNNCTGTAVDGTVLDGYITTFDNAGTDDRILFVWFNDNGVHAASLGCVANCT